MSGVEIDLTSRTTIGQVGAMEDQPSDRRPSAVQVLVDAMIDRARTDWPDVEFILSIPQAESLLLPKHSDRLYRTVEGRLGSYAAPVYRDVQVEPYPASAGVTSVQLSPLWQDDTPADAPAYVGDLTTGEFETRVAGS